MHNRQSNNEHNFAVNSGIMKLFFFFNSEIATFHIIIKKQQVAHWNMKFWSTVERLKKYFTVKCTPVAFSKLHSVVFTKLYNKNSLKTTCFCFITSFELPLQDRCWPAGFILLSSLRLCIGFFFFSFELYSLFFRLDFYLNSHYLYLLL